LDVAERIRLLVANIIFQYTVDGYGDPCDGLEGLSFIKKLKVRNITKLLSYLYQLANQQLDLYHVLRLYQLFSF